MTNREGEQALNYDHSEWKATSVELLNQTKFLQSFHKNNVLASLENIRADWSFIRDSGYGVQYDGGVIDPMFDSELFTVFSLFSKYKSKFVNENRDTSKFFQALFHSLENETSTGDELIKKISEWLPCDIFICEEHLKNWVVKRAYAESAFLNSKYRTKEYFVTGMGLLNDRRMSASRGNAILTKDLINSFGGTRARLIILLTGGHPSRIYQYDEDLPRQAEKLLKRIQSYVSYLLSIMYDEEIEDKRKSELDSKVSNIEKKLERSMREGSYRQVLLELGSALPRRYKSVNVSEAKQLFYLYNKYLGYLLPSLQNSFDFDTA